LVRLCRSAEIDRLPDRHADANLTAAYGYPDRHPGAFVQFPRKDGSDAACELQRF
jgi:hypothetical protein